MTDPNVPNDPNVSNGPDPDETGSAPIDGLRDLEIDLGEDLEGRVRRDINRRTLAADSLDFTFNVMLATFWEHLRSVIESWPGTNAGQSPADDRPQD